MFHEPANDTQTSDEDLLAQIASGDHEAYRLLVRRHAERYYRVAYRVLLQRQDAEDMVQHAFLKIWEKPQLWQAGKGASFRTWFSRVVVNLCIDLQRSRKPMAGEGALAMMADTDMAADEKLSSRQQQAQVQQAMAGLPEQQRAALSLCHFEEYSNREAAEILGISIKAIESLLVRARKSLRDQLAHLQPNSQGGEAA